MPEDRSLAARTGASLRQYRVSQGLSLKEIAERAGMTGPSLSAVEAGRANPTLERLERIGHAYGVDLALAIIHSSKEVASA